VHKTDRGTANLLALIYPYKRSRRSRVISSMETWLEQVMIWCWSHNEESGPWNWAGDRLDSVCTTIRRLRGWRFYRYHQRTGRWPR